MTDSTSVIILCGGAGQRLAGADKPLLEINGIPIIETIRRRLASLGPVLISANRNLDEYQRYGQVCVDILAAHQGPLAGIAACLACTTSANVFVCPGDCPDLQIELAQRLLQHLSESQDTVDASCAHDGERRQYLHIALRTRAAASLQAYLNNGGRSVRGWLSALEVIDVDCRDLQSSLADFDTQHEFDRFSP